MTRLEIFCNLGFKVDPFKAAPVFETGDTLRVSRILTMAVESRSMVCIVGERLAGKSRSVNAALASLKIKQVKVDRLDQEKLTIADIRSAIILELSEDGIKRGGIQSTIQLRRVLGSAVREHKQKIVVVIEEAQRLHPNTLKALKTLRELEWCGEAELCTIVLLSQSDPMQLPGVSEVKLRSDTVRLHGLSTAEAEGYVRATLGKHFDDAALAALADLPAARNYGDLQELCVKLLNVALADGRDKVIADDVRDAVGAKKESLARGGKERPVVTPITGKEALGSVLARRTGDAPAGKAAAAC